MSRYLAVTLVATLLSLQGSSVAGDAIKERLTMYQVVIPQTQMESLASEGRYAEALEPAGQILRIATSRSDTAWMASAHQIIAILSERLGRADSARNHAIAAVSLARATSARTLESSSLLLLGRLQGSFGSVDSSFSCLEAATNAGLASADSVDASAALAALADLLMGQAQFHFALGRLDSALTFLGPEVEHASLEDLVVRRNVFSARGRCLYHVHRYVDACDAFELAYALLTRLRTFTLSDRGRMHLMDQASTDFFEEWQDAWLSRGKTSTFLRYSLGVAERARGQALLDLLQPADTMVTDPNGIEHSTFSTSRRFGPGRDMAQDVLAALKELIPAGSALVYYRQLPDSLQIWAFRDSAVMTIARMYPSRSVDPVGASDLWNDFVERAGPDSAFGAFGDLCFPVPLFNFVRSAREVIIVPDGWLSRVPFAALRVGRKHDRLGLTCALRLAPSLGLLERAESRLPEPFGPNSVLVMGDPPSSCGPAIPGSRIEAARVAAMFGTRPFLGPAATESLATSRWSNLRLLHLATHGIAEADPDRTLDDSYVCLWPTQGRDGRLTAREVYGLPQSHCDLVFLSACQTALGAATRADATMGLPRAFISSGARTVIASMWLLPDTSTAYLVERFYRHLLLDPARPPKSEAMRLAMLDTSRRWPNPKSWAGFQVIGAH